MDNEQDVEVLEETPETIVEETVVEEEIVEEEVAVEDEFAVADEDEDEKEEEEDEEFKKDPKTKCELEEEVVEDEEPQVEEVVEEEPAPDFQAEIESYKATIEELKAEVAALREFRLQAENEKKDSLIAKYFMLTDEQKADVVANKSTYSYEDIEAKLALIYVNANAASIFSLEDEEEEEEVLDSNPAMMFSLDTSDDFTTSDLLRALRNTKH